MRTVLVVPEDVRVDLARHARERHGHDWKSSEHLVLEGAEESLDDGDAAAPSDGAEARSNAASTAPRAVVGLKLRALIGDDVLRRDAAPTARGVEHADDVASGGLGEEEPRADDGAGVVIEDGGEPEGRRAIAGGAPAGSKAPRSR